MDPLFKYACMRICDLESLLLVDVIETVWPAEVGMVYGQIKSAGDLPAHYLRHANITATGCGEENVFTGCYYII